MKTYLSGICVLLCLLTSCGTSERQQFQEDFLHVLESMPEEMDLGSGAQALEGFQDMRTALLDLDTSGLDAAGLAAHRSVMDALDRIDVVAGDEATREERLRKAYGDLMIGIMVLSMDMGE